MSNFYNLPKIVQWIIAIILLVAGFGIFMPIIRKPYGILLLPFIAPFLNFVMVPFCRLMGFYKYLNPYVISTVQNDEKYDLHNVFTFDYFVNFKWSDRGIKVQKTILVHYFKALNTIIERIERGELSPQVKVIGHSYFFNERTAQKLGFTISNASIFWKINSIIQFFELSYLYSFSQGKLSIPKFWKVKRAEISGSDLVNKKEIIQRLINGITY